MPSNNNVPHFCGQLFLPAELAGKAIEIAVKENPENLLHSPDISTPPAGGIASDRGMESSTARALVGSGTSRLGLFVRKMWANGRTLRVRFLSGGSPYIRSKVQQYANVWSEHANIYFQFVESGPAEIRIAFESDGSWSYLGTDALLRPENEATMNYGWFSDYTNDEEFSRTVIHEFGHAIGCVHEHSQPNANIQWNKPVVYEAYRKSQGWTQEQVDFNLFKHYTDADVTSSSFDSASIMEYPIPKEFTTDGFFVDLNTHLSRTDIAFIGKMYPKKTNPPASVDSNLEIGVFNTVSGAGFRTLINFSKKHPSPPAFNVGINFLDFDNSRNLRIKPLVEAVLATQAVLSLKPAEDTIQYDSGVSWFLYSSQDKDFQRGSFVTKETSAVKTVTFDREYPSIPKVLVFFTLLNIDKSESCCVKTYASELTTRGFKLNVETWSNTKPLEIGASWIALPASKKNIAAGSFSTEEVRPSSTPRPNTNSVVAFSQKFSRPPKVFLGLNMLNIDRDTQTRVRLSASKISEEKMEWHIDGWGGTYLYAAGGTYIAIEG